MAIMSQMSASELNIDELIAEFLADEVRSSLELPHMTTGQRKQTKKVLDQHPEITCESYGFGPERQLHLFKNGRGADTEKHMGNNSVEHVLASSSPGTPSKSKLQCIMEGPVCKLDMTGVEGCSTAPPSSCPSDGSPASTFREMLPPWFGPPPGLEIEVRNTFVHFDSPSHDPRGIQSMPHNMFRRCLLAESSHSPSGQPAVAMQEAPRNASPLTHKVEEDMLLAGTQVTIHGLGKCPAFNGLKATVQSFDVETARYNIFLSAPAGGRTMAKVKRENLLLTSACEFLELLPKPPAPQLQSTAQCARKRSRQASKQAQALKQTTDVPRKSTTAPSTLQLTALV